MANAMTWEEAHDRLKKIRDEGLRNSDEVLEIWDECLADFSYKLADEAWLVYEQVCIAACDCGQIDVAEMCIDALKAKFPGSMRVRKLMGMKFEAEDKYENAMHIYEEIKLEDPTNTAIWKRIIAVNIAQNKISEAIKDLNDYLKQFMSDYEAWLELSDLYLEEQDYGRAAFCLEELILSNPHNHLYHQRYAEIKYTAGGTENLELARSYFSYACRLCPSNMRALYGLFLSSSGIAVRGNSKQKKENLKFASWAADQISCRYKGNDQGVDESGQLNAIEGMLDSLQITQGIS